MTWGPCLSPSSGGAGERGTVTAWLLVMPLLVLLVGGMTVDLWAAMSARSRIAAIADDAAVAGATAVSDASARGADQQVTVDVPDAVRRALVAVDSHPGAVEVTGRSAAATPDLVSVTVQGRFQFLFLQLVGATAGSISVTGHAAPASVP